MSLDEELRIWNEKARKAEEEAVASGSRFRYIGEIVDGQIVNDQDTIDRNSFANRLNRGEHLRFIEKNPEPEEPPLPVDGKTWREVRGFNRFGTKVSGSSFLILVLVFIYSSTYSILSYISFFLGIIFFVLFLICFIAWRWTPDSDEMTTEYLKYVNDLIKALKDDSKNVRHNAAQALEKIEWEKDSYGEISNYDGIRSDYLLAKGDSDLNLEKDMNQAGDVVPKKEATKEMDEEEKNSTSGRSIVIKDNVVRRSRVGGLEKYETEHERDDTGNELIINILSKEEGRKRRVQKAKERESALDYDSAIKIWEQLGQTSEAVRVRKLKANLAAPKTEIHGDYIDDRDITVKDSVISKSSIGAGGDDKFARLEKLTEMKKEGLIDDAEFKQMKKEILGKKVKKIIKKTRKLRR